MMMCAAWLVFALGIDESGKSQRLIVLGKVPFLCAVKVLVFFMEMALDRGDACWKVFLHKFYGESWPCGEIFLLL